MKTENRTLAKTGMIFFLISLTVLFGASIWGYVWVRSFREEAWLPEGFVFDRIGIYTSTVLILLSSAFFFASNFYFRKGEYSYYQIYFRIAFLFGIAFLGSQFHNWRELYEQNIRMDTKALFSFCFYFLTGIHALHILGGIFPMSFVAFRPLSFRLSFLENLEMYWHFLGMVWILLSLLFLFT